MNNVVSLNDFKAIEQIVKDRCGSKFVIAFIDGTDCHTYLSEDLTDMEACYIADTINERRREHEG